MRHLFEKCPNLNAQDRARVFAIAQEVKTTGGYPITMFENGGSSDQSFNESQSDLLIHDDGSNEEEAVLSLQREPSALDTLAEVSRQHLDLSRQRQIEGTLQPQGSHEEANDLEGLYAVLKQSLEADSGEQVQEGAHAMTATALMADNNPLMQTASAANDLQAALSQHAAEGAKEDTEDRIRNALTMRSEQELQAISHLDPQLQTEETTPMTSRSHHRANASPMPPHVQQIQAYQAQSQGLPQWAYPVPKGGYGVLQRPFKKQTRGKFSDERRKEVQGMRKLGACIRCRMLKKPCSGEDPCGTCRTVASARLWKNQCIRTRIPDEFTLYMTSLFHAKAHTKVHTLLSGKLVERVNGRIEASLFPEMQTYATFNPMVTRATNKINTGINPAFNGLSDDVSTRLEMYLLDFESDDVTGKLECYLVDNTNKFVEQEPSQFLKTSLSTATHLIGQQGDVLLAKAINLWIATQVLACSKEDRWLFSYAVDRLPGPEPELVPDYVRSSTSTVHLPADLPDYEAIKAQILDAAERYCAKQGKAVMTELERRLLQRQQACAFTTFLVSVILLSCVERMTCLYRTFDENTTTPSDPSTEIPDDANAEQVSTTPHNQPYFPADWPLDHPPSAFWSQGHTFSSLFHTLLRMRGLPPRTAFRENGTLTVINNSKSYPVEIAHDPTLSAAKDPQLFMMAQWLEQTALTAEQFEHAKHVGDGPPGEGVASWDLRFIVQLLEPS